MSVETKAPSSRVTGLRRILGCYLSCHAKLDLLVFWGRYPGGWFARRAVSPLTRMSRKEIEESLDELVAEGVIDCRRDGAMSLYALTPDVSIRKAVEELPRLTPSERSQLLRHSVRQRVIMDHRHDSETTPNVTEDTLEGGTP